MYIGAKKVGYWDIFGEIVVYWQKKSTNMINMRLVVACQYMINLVIVHTHENWTGGVIAG